MAEMRGARDCHVIWNLSKYVLLPRAEGNTDVRGDSACDCSVDSL